jgi:tetratricopeptide (TPR) repeat protein
MARPLLSVEPADGPDCEMNVPSDRQPNDYRMYNSTAQSRWSIADLKRNHYDPAMRAMHEGSYSRGVKADLAFILNWWPNHYVALQALVAYDFGGGKDYDYPPTECYFERAKSIFPDDVEVRVIEGYYFWRKHDKRRAVASYEEALAINPASADAHYNLGLIYLEMSQFDKAREHARIAYAAGYPLPGLRKKLAQAGYALSP